MSERITSLNPGQGLTANLVTAALVLGASRLGLPVSTTHVSCGAIFGIGLIGRSSEWKTIARILTAWATTLPLAALLAAGAFWLLKQNG
jgi:PiT family inorganic phosphate transporter